MSRRELESHKYATKYKSFIIFKSNGTAFIPGGDNNMIAKDFDRMQEILLRNLNLQDIDWIEKENRFTNKGESIMYLREDLAKKIRDTGKDVKSVFPARMKYLDEERKKAEEEETINRPDWLYDRLGENTSIPVVMMILGLRITVSIITVSIFLSLIFIAGLELYPALLDSFAKGDYLVYFLLLIPGSILLYLYLMSLKYLSKIF